ncbi:autophagy protein 13 [Fusarium irregulare]|uniref:Autophagy-related protein 13 n=1 Tax=Fusarium irregulare TaxID=2494466 RepID=A0A9W8PGP5_9HYPO|nr:autophagy protein 13 [Fusarium irregulare]KAJ4005315.1 autophagy protein 13 [Fusarium irregulare]
MHQQPRGPARVSSPGATPQPNLPSRSNSTREAVLGSRPRAGSNFAGRDVPNSPSLESPPTLAPPADSVRKLDQIIQNFYAKAAVLVLDSRIKSRPARGANGARKPNKWFQIETDEIDDFRDELKIWKNCGSLDNHPPPMVIEVYLDASRLKDSQSLVIVDENGKRWDVMEQLNSSGSSTDSSSGASRRNNEVVIERWQVELKHSGMTSTDFGPILPTVYKKAIVFFRSLFITTRLLPAWKFASQGAAKNSHPALVPRCRIRLSHPERSRYDQLRLPIDGRPDPVTEYVFGDLEVPVGRLSTVVTYRNDCNFRVDDSEALLSSRFMGVDENFFRPSLPQQHDTSRAPAAEIGSLRDHRSRPNLSDVQQAYGSLSTFHGNVPVGTSPISALRSVRPPGSDTSSPPGSVPAQHDVDGPSSLPVRQSTTRPPLPTFEGSGRRPSVSFQPFKAGSLSGSPVPRQLDAEPASPQSLTRSGIPSLRQPGNRTSLTAGMPASLRGGPPATSGDTAVAGSPRPASTSRYSSSFTHRRGRLSFGGASRAGDDEQSSSGRQSLASSVAQPGSGLLAEVAGTSSDSLRDDNEQLEDFIKALDSKKTLQSFKPSKKGESATNKTVAQLSRFHMMKDSNNALTESMTSSVQMQRSSSSSSRQLTSVPGMTAPASVSASSSPGKPLSPHTPHTPAIPSRLSENSIIDYTGQGRITSRQGRTSDSTQPGTIRENTITQDGTTAIDIPLSPRLATYQRRASSVALQNRSMVDDDETDSAFAHRSISLGADDREPPTLSILLGRQMQLEEESTQRESDALQPAADAGSAETPDILQRGLSEENPPEGLIPAATSSSPFGRRRYMGMASHRQTPPQSSRGSFTGSLNRQVRGDDDSVNEEPLVFDLSEMDPQGRRSIEEARSGAGGPSIGPDRGGYESRSASRRGW